MDCDWKIDQRIYAGTSITIAIVLCVLLSKTNHELMISHLVIKLQCSVYWIGLFDAKMSLVNFTIHYIYYRLLTFFISFFFVTSLFCTKMRSASSCVVVGRLYNRWDDYRSQWLRGVISLLQHGLCILIIGHKLLSRNMYAVMYGN